MVRAQHCALPFMPLMGGREGSLEEMVSTMVALEMKVGEAANAVQRIVAESQAPTVHKFAAGVPGFTGKDVSKAIGGDKSLLDEAFEGCIPLDLAIASGNTSRLQALLDMGADPNCKKGMTETTGQ